MLICRECEFKTVEIEEGMVMYHCLLAKCVEEGEDE